MGKRVTWKSLIDNKIQTENIQDTYDSEFSSYHEKSILAWNKDETFFQNLQREKTQQGNRQIYEEKQLRKKLLNYDLLQDLKAEIKSQMERHSVCLSQYDRDMMPTVMHAYIDVWISSREAKKYSEGETYIAQKIHDFNTLLQHIYGSNWPYTVLWLCGFAQEMIMDQSKKNKAYTAFPFDNHEYYDMEEGEGNVMPHGFTIIRHVSGDFFIVDPTFKQFNVKEITDELWDQESNPIYRLLQLPHGHKIALWLLQDGYIKADEQILQTYFAAMWAWKMKAYKTYSDYFDALPKLSWYKDDMNFKKAHKPMKLLQNIEELLRCI